MCVWYYSLECISLLVFALERINLCVAALDIVIKLSFLWFPVPEAGLELKVIIVVVTRVWVCAPYIMVWSAYLC